jgi:4-diphosphocytidyl-2-C-methyl-D-erythritol kinase
MLMQAIDLYDTVTVTIADAVPAENGGIGERRAADTCCADAVLGPQDFEYGQSDLAYKAALLMAEHFRPELITQALDEDGTELAAGIRGVRIRIEKRIPAAAGLAGGSADAAAVITALGKLWMPEKDKEELLKTLLPLGAMLGSDVPFCIASQLGHPVAIARGRGTDLEFVKPTDFAVDLYFPDVAIPNKTRAVYAELKEADCEQRFSIESFLNAASIEEKRRFMGNHLQAPAERLIKKYGEKGPTEQQLNTGCKRPVPEIATLSGAGPTYFTISEDGAYRTILR